MSNKSKAGGFREGSGRPKGSLGEKSIAVQSKLESLGVISKLFVSEF